MAIFSYYPDNIFWILVTKIEPSRRFFEGKSRLSPHLTYTSHYYNSTTNSTKDNQFQKVLKVIKNLYNLAVPCAGQTEDICHVLYSTVSLNTHSVSCTAIAYVFEVIFLF